MSPLVAPAGVILAGGRSSRMGMPQKALVRLRGQTLLARVIASLKPQLGSLMISSEHDNGEFESFGLPVVPDLLPHHRGPLMGVYSALHQLADQGQDLALVLCPCDAPFIPPNLVEVMLEAGHGKEKPLVIISYQGVLQPTFSMWNVRHLGAVHDAVVNRGQGGLKQMLDSLPHSIVEWAPSRPPPFFNINTPQALNTAAGWLDCPPAETDDS